MTGNSEYLAGSRRDRAARRRRLHCIGARRNCGTAGHAIGSAVVAPAPASGRTRTAERLVDGVHTAQSERCRSLPAGTGKPPRP
jgi:hypothetical protein